jgi:creatinine amidohydrolase
MMMEWMKMTAPDFVKAVKTSGGVCAVPLGSIEKHGNHLPTGIDSYNVEARTRRACEKARVVMFPVIPFMENSSAMANPGAVAMRAEVLMPFLWNLFDEIGRNGFRKIIMVNGHGGNRHLVGYLLQDFLIRQPDYLLYLCTLWYRDALTKELMETENQAHGGELETSVALHNVGDLVKMEDVPGREVPFLGRYDHVKGADPAGKWYADVPQHYVGDARPATAEKGRRLVEDVVERMAHCFDSVRKDRRSERVYREYRERRARGGARK